MWMDDSKESQKLTHFVRSPPNLLIESFGSFTWGVASGGPIVHVVMGVVPTVMVVVTDPGMDAAAVILGIPLEPAVTTTAEDSTMYQSRSRGSDSGSRAGWCQGETNGWSHCAGDR